MSTSLKELKSFDKTLVRWCPCEIKNENKFIYCYPYKTTYENPSGIYIYDFKTNTLINNLLPLIICYIKNYHSKRLCSCSMISDHSWLS